MVRRPLLKQDAGIYPQQNGRRSFAPGLEALHMIFALSFRAFSAGLRLDLTAWRRWVHNVESEAREP